MSLVTQALDDLLGGVSQQPAPLRDASQGQEQINGSSQIATGLSKRPPARYAGTLISGAPPAGYDSALVHSVARAADDRYRVVLVDGDLKVFDAVTNTEETVLFPNGKTYLNTSNPIQDFRCVTVGDKTYIVNRSVITAKGSTVSEPQRNEALVSIRQGDYATTYSVTLEGTTVSLTTPDEFSPTDRSAIATDTIATDIQALIEAESALSAFVVTRYGSTLYIKRSDDADFTISASDGLADEAIRTIKKSVQRFDDLPDRAKDGFVVEVTGDPSNQFDNYFVKYDDNGLPNLAGVWKETVKPGILTSLDYSSMPHVLVRGASLVDGVEAGSLPDDPAIGYGDDATVINDWEVTDDVTIDTSSAIADPSASVDIGAKISTNIGGAASASLSALNGNHATIRVNYDVSTTNLTSPSGNVVRVQMWISNAASTAPTGAANYTQVDEKVYPHFTGTLSHEYMEYTADALPSDTRVQVRVVYGTDPGTTSAAVLLHPNVTVGDKRPGIEVTIASGRTATFDPLGVYPEGCDVTVTVAGTPYTYTTVVGDTGTDVAAGLAPLIGGGYTGSTPSAGVLLVSGTPLPTFVVDVAFDNDTTFYSPDLVLVTDALVGETIQNLSDGSSGIITSNTTNTITVAALTGGATNVFNRGDLCTVESSDTDTFVFQEILWKARVVGDAITIPWPSFMGKPIDEIFFNKNRLCLVSKQTVVQSRAADHTNFFRQSATKLLADDVIDVQASSAGVANFHSAVHWNESLMLWSSTGQFDLDGTPNMTPETVSIVQTTAFANTPRVSPVAAGRKLFFARGKGNSTQIMEYGVVAETGAADAEDVTKHIPSYLPGTPVAMVCDPSQQFLALLTDDDQSKLFVYSYHYASQTLVQSAWSRWEFSAGTRIIGMDIMDAKLALVVKRADGVFLEVIDLDPLADTPDGYTDTLSTGNVPYTFSYTFSTLYKRGVDRSGRPVVDQRGRLTIRYLTIKFHDTTNFTVTVTADGRAARTYVWNSPSQSGTGSYRIPILCRNTNVSIVISDATTGSCHIDGVEWEGTHSTIASRV